MLIISMQLFIRYRSKKKKEVLQGQQIQSNSGIAILPCKSHAKKKKNKVPMNNFRISLHE